MAEQMFDNETKRRLAEEDAAIERATQRMAAENAAMEGQIHRLEEQNRELEELAREKEAMLREVEAFAAQIDSRKRAWRERYERVVGAGPNKPATSGSR